LNAPAAHCTDETGQKIGLGFVAAVGAELIALGNKHRKWLVLLQCC
jgi:hypothetical protein